MSREGYHWTREEFDWAKREVLNIIKKCPQEECWEEHIFEEMCGQSDVKWWRCLQPGLRAMITSSAIATMVYDNTISAVPGRTQSSGRRCLTYTNPLVRVAEAL